MNDKELLKFAAKAINKKNWQCTSFYSDARCDSNGVPYWNPLTNDSDALRLAVKLHIELYFVAPSTKPNWTTVASIKDCHLITECFDDHYAATRRAIVRAAAEIGKEKECKK